MIDVILQNIALLKNSYTFDVNGIGMNSSQVDVTSTIDMMTDYKKLLCNV